MLNKWISLIVLALILSFCKESLAMDYTVFTHQELLELRDYVAQASEEELKAYEKEWKRRLQLMNQEDRMMYEDALRAKQGQNSSSSKKKIPVVIQGKGYDQGKGIVIYGGPPSTKKEGEEKE